MSTNVNDIASLNQKIMKISKNSVGTTGFGAAVGVLSVCVLTAIILGSVSLNESSSSATQNINKITANFDTGDPTNTGVSVNLVGDKYQVSLDYSQGVANSFISLLQGVEVGIARANRVLTLDENMGVSGISTVTSDVFYGKLGSDSPIQQNPAYISGLSVTNGSYHNGILISGDTATNSAIGLNSAIIGGEDNIIIGGYSVASGGEENIIRGENSSNNGGNNNIIDGSYSANVGGSVNGVSGNYSGNFAGTNNRVSSVFSSNIAGQSNIIDAGASNSVTIGGVSNRITSAMSFISGGNNNTVSGSSSAIISSTGCCILKKSGLGGYNNTILSGDNCNITGGYGSLIVGNDNTLTGDGTTAGTGGFDNIVLGTQNVISNYNQCVATGHGISITDSNIHNAVFAFGTFNSEGVCLRGNSNGDRIAFLQGKGSSDAVRDTGVIIDVNGNILLKNGTSIYTRDDTGGTPPSLKAFTIQHPTLPNRWLRHGCLEGPEGGVYYRGKGEAPATIRLPDYATRIASDFTVQVTPIGSPRMMSASEVSPEGTFRVYGEGKFHWNAIGERVPLEVEPLKTDVTIHSMGPYSWSV